MQVLLAVFIAMLFVKSADARWYPCPLVRWYVANHSQAEIDEMARQYKVTAKEKRAALACLKEKK
jgi:hypothetical protein